MDKVKKKIERYLNHEASGSDLRDIRRWFETDIDLGEWFREGIESSEPRIDPEVDARIRAYLSEEMERSETARRRDRRDSHRRLLHRAVDMAAIALVLMGIGMLLYVNTAESTPTRVAARTGTGQRSELTLPDGTRVSLNAKSRVEYCYDESDGIRDVNISGEAYFDVAHDPEHPFVVRHDNITVECRGTEFDVKAYDDDRNVTVVLNEGAVVVSDRKTSITMNANMKVSYDKHEGRFTSQRVYAEDYNGWIEGSMRFNDERLCDIIRELGRHYDTRFTITSPELAEERFNGNLGGGSLEDCMRVLATAAGASYSLQGDSVAILY